MTAVETARPKTSAEPAVQTRYLIVDTESAPDGELIAQVKYPGETLSPEEAIAKAQLEARAASYTGSDFLPVTLQIPIAVCVLRVGSDYGLQAIKCLDAPQFRPTEIVRLFWQGVDQTYPKANLVTFNGRGFDLPLMELAAYRQGLSLANYWHRSRDRFNGNHIDVQERLTNRGASKLVGGLNLLAKLLGKPGKTAIAGHQVYQMHCEGRLADINDYCLCDTLDTYFVFLRTCVLTGDLAVEREAAIVQNAREFLEARVVELPVLKEYLDGWRS